MESTSTSQLEFAIFSNGTSNPIELGSTRLNFTDALQPMHLRLARTSEPNKMRVSFSVSRYHADATVRWGYFAGGPYATVAAEASTYSKDDMCGPPATTHGWWPTPWFYSSVVGPFACSSESIGQSHSVRFPPNRTTSSQHCHKAILNQVG